MGGREGQGVGERGTVRGRGWEGGREGQGVGERGTVREAGGRDGRTEKV